MLSLYLAKFREWLLEKEEEMAKNCKISSVEVEKEITKLFLEKEELKEKCQDEKAELEHLLDKLHWIKAEAIKCQEKLKKEIEK